MHYLKRIGNKVNATIKKTRLKQFTGNVTLSGFQRIYPSNLCITMFHKIYIPFEFSWLHNFSEIHSLLEVSLNLNIFHWSHMATRYTCHTKVSLVAYANQVIANPL